MMPPVSHSIPPLLKLLAHEVRWQLVTALAQSDRRVQELVAHLHRPQNLISYHLRRLREGALVHERRSSADGRDVYYSLDLEHLGRLYRESGRALHPALVGWEPEDPLAEASGGRGGRPCRILFLCTHNSARSQLAEGILRAQAGERVAAFSAGSAPTAPHPLAVRAAAEIGIDIAGQRSRHMNEFAAQTFDYVITVCDRMREICPVFPDDHKQIHWSFPDPAEVTGSEEQQLHAFFQTAQELTVRIHYLLLMMERHPQQIPGLG